MLDHYSCTKCGAHPNGEKEIFSGCASCGNRFFKIQDVDKNLEESSLNTTKNYQTNQSLPRDSFTSIEVDGTGVYRVNVDKLFKDTNKTKKSPFMVSEEEGVYHIKL